MDERLLQFRVGATVLAALILAGILTALFSDLPNIGLAASRYTLFIHFPNAPGVSADTPVRKSGILIGRVREVAFAADGGVIVTAAIDPDVQLRKSEICRIAGSILGDADLEFVQGSRQSKDYLKDGDLIAGMVRTDPLEVVSNIEGSLNQAISSIAGTSDEVGRLSRNLADLLENNQEQVSRIVSKAEETLDVIRSLASNVEGFVDDPDMQADLKEALSMFPEVLTETRTAIESVKHTVELADKNLQNLEGLTEPLGDQGEQIVTRINSTLARVDEMAGELSQFTRALNESEGSLGQFLNNPDLYQNLNAAAENIVQLTRDVRPIVYDARVALDKVARDPGGEIGVRGVLRRRTGIN